jgi:hypothetical protein
MAIKVEAKGVNEVMADFHGLADDLDTNIPGMREISKKYASLASSFAPKKTGNLANSIKPFRSDVTAGAESDVAYAATINYGSPKRGIVASLFMQRADSALTTYVLSTIEEGVDELIKDRGLEP